MLCAFPGVQNIPTVENPDVSLLARLVMQRLTCVAGGLLLRREKTKIQGPSSTCSRGEENNRLGGGGGAREKQRPPLPSKFMFCSSPRVFSRILPTRRWNFGFSVAS